MCQWCCKNYDIEVSVTACFHQYPGLPHPTVVHECTNCLHVWNCVHLCNVLGISGRHGGAKLGTGI